ncbi:hypothetical protein QT381_05635 [Galbitalea sp. SE-J8]|uniref:hypothetical protein n=1 Tax=Galbitalea sp. SE-J8 TaxID=3054952 RepID=UPI00259CBE55|nr:hypothetical protein [Galbitalea sp. SE-J8]MDM4762484.1 hypothetical protein [Galbitalea sp. SE-J8]
MREIREGAELIPADLLGRIDPALPALLGRVAMTSALLEREIALLTAAIVGGKSQTRVRARVSANIRGIRRALDGARRQPAWAAHADAVESLLRRASALLVERDRMLRVVWTQPGGSSWGGHPGSVVDPPVGTALPTWTDADRIDVGPERLEQLVLDLAAAATDASHSVARFASYRRPATIAPANRAPRSGVGDWGRVATGDRVELRGKRALDRRSLSVVDVLPRTLADRHGILGDDGVEYRQFHWDLRIIG